MSQGVRAEGTAGAGKLPEYMTLREVAAACRCSLMTVRRRIAQKKFKDVPFTDVFGDGRLLAPKDKLLGFLRLREKATAREYDGSGYLHTNG